MSANAKTAPPGAILIVDDEPAMRHALAEVLRRSDWKADAAESGEAALVKLREGAPYRLMMTDYRMPGMDGLELARAAKKLRPEMPVVMMTAYGAVEDAVAAMKEGVRDYLLKPFSFEAVMKVVGEATADAQAESSAAISAPRPARPEGSGAAMLGNAPAWRRVVRMADEVADSGATVLLSGESGTGKEVLARRLHAMSGRRGPLVAVNCAALPDGVLESELFGHEKGAFTGALLARKGRFELAHEGTILLDEVSEIPLSLQAKLLRVLQEREVFPIGGDASVKVDVRVIATTNRNLERYAREGHFREDLFFRLNVISIELPPLRERPGDALALAEHFFAKFRRADRPAQGMSAELRSFLERYAWPGNVRELENLMERACLLGRGAELGVEDLHLTAGAPPAQFGPRRVSPAGTAAPADGGPGGANAISEEEPSTLDAMERRMILAALERNGGNRTRAAEALGVSVRTIRNKLHQYGMSEEAAGAAA